MIKCSQPTITSLEKKYLSKAVENNDIGVGEFIKKFEDTWAEWNLQYYGVACTSATTALFLALKALGIKEGDEVIVPQFTMTATAWSVSYTGATPVFVDCKDDLNIDVDKIVITEKTKAIIPVHIYGRQADMHSILALARKHNLYVVEDMAEAHGIIPMGDVACFSFYGNKILTTGEGGMCLTNDEDIANEIRQLANMYFDKNRTLLHPKIGYNFRMTNLQAAIGYAQAQRIDEILHKREQIEEWYTEELPKEMLMPKRNTLWMYDIDCGDYQEYIKQGLEKAGIESRYFFKPMSQQPMYLGDYQSLNAYKWAKRGLYLPTYYDLTKIQIKFITKTICDLWGDKK